MKLNTILKALLFILYGFIVTSCQTNEVVLPIGTNSVVLTPTETLIPIQQLLITPTPSFTQTPSFTPTPKSPVVAYCTSKNISVPLTESQIAFLEKSNYEFLLSSSVYTINNIYPINRAETICGPIYKTQDGVDTANVFKVISGFIIDTNAPNKNIYDPGGKNFANVYIKVRFVAQDGSGHDYWMRLPGFPPDQTFQVVRWNQPIDTQQIMDIFRKEKSADGTEAYVDVRSIIPNQLLKVNQQFIALILAGTADNNTASLSGIGLYGDTENKFLDALEGKADFPSAPEGFYLEANALIVPMQP